MSDSPATPTDELILDALELLNADERDPAYVEGWNDLAEVIRSILEPPNETPEQSAVIVEANLSRMGLGGSGVGRG